MDPRIEKWLQVIDRYYLSDFIGSGGSAFKLLLTRDDGQTQEALRGLKGLAEEHGYFYAHVSAAETRVDRIDQVFFAVASQADWNKLAERCATDLLERLNYIRPHGASLSDLDAIADASGCTKEDLTRTIRRRITDEIGQSTKMCKDFRTALSQLYYSQFFPSNVEPKEADILVGWLRGEKVSLASLNRLGISSRIDRYNARDMITALAHQMAKFNDKGIVIGLDLGALLIPRASREPFQLASHQMLGYDTGVTQSENAPSSLHYPRGRFLDACEVLRQFIDDLDEITHCLICCVGPSSLETHEKQSLFSYLALQYRLFDDVHDRDTPNLLAPVVRLADVSY
ncbi:MAG: BREX system ATP-binding domain-containing protein [Armatimonadota bacterium]